jgi:hypothetical protein
MTVATAVVALLLMATLIAFSYVASKGGRAANLNVVHDPALRGSHGIPMQFAIGGPVQTKNVRDLKLEPDHRRCPQCNGLGL